MCTINAFTTDMNNTVINRVPFNYASLTVPIEGIWHASYIDQPAFN